MESDSLLNHQSRLLPYLETFVVHMEKRIINMTRKTEYELDLFIRKKNL